MTVKPRLKWEAPFIKPHGLGELNKFGRRSARNEIIEEIDGVSINELVRLYGSPLFVTSERRLRENIRRIRRAFDARWHDVTHGWSYKTNYTSAVCNILHQEGSIAEVVSGFEYEKARSLGVPGACIIFNGPNKSRKALERAIAEGAMIHVDHFDELDLIGEIALALRKHVKLALRLTFETGFTEAWSRFGFHLESGQALEAARRIFAHPHLELSGLHSHIGTFILDPRAYAAQVKVLCEFMREMEAEQGKLLDYLDVGGGLPSKNALQGMYLTPDQAVPHLDEYAAAICDALREGTHYRRENGQPLPRLIFESGRAVVDDAQQLITSVAGTKLLPDGRRAAILDAGVNLLFTGFWYDHDVKLTREIAGAPMDTVLYGPLCMNIDVVRRSIRLPALSPGDRLVIGPTGAYNNTQWMQFIEYRPAIVLVHMDGEHSIIRAGEKLDDMNRLDRLPAHLAQPFAKPRPMRAA